jgi:hypothetical protein
MATNMPPYCTGSVCYANVYIMSAKETRLTSSAPSKKSARAGGVPGGGGTSEGARGSTSRRVDDGTRAALPPRRLGSARAAAIPQQQHSERAAQAALPRKQLLPCLAALCSRWTGLGKTVQAAAQQQKAGSGSPRQEATPRRFGMPARNARTPHLVQPRPRLPFLLARRGSASVTCS